jgi:hypothetical protein
MKGMHHLAAIVYVHAYLGNAVAGSIAARGFYIGNGVFH